MSSARIEVDLGRLRANLARIRSRVDPARHLLVVKDDAYGHGLSPVVRTAADAGVGWFGTFDIATAAAVRAQVGPTPRIIAWTIYDDTDLDVAADADIDLGVGSARLLTAVSRHAMRIGRPARVHLKIDTGLHRNGVRPEEWATVAAAARDAHESGVIALVGVWSHIAEASDAEDERSRQCFIDAVRALEPLAPLRHLAASAAGYLRAEFRFDLVRIGAFAYGIRPAGGPSDEELGISPVAGLVAPVIDGDAQSAVVAVGWLDGLDSRLAGRLTVGTPGGPRTVERIESGQLVVPTWEGARPGQDVRILGAGAPMSMTDAAELTGTIGEEVMLRLNAGLPRDILP